MTMNAMMKLVVILSFVGICLAKPDPKCPCLLEESQAYPSTYFWNCLGLSLTAVPGQCWNIQSENVTGVCLCENSITSIRNIDFAGLNDLRELYLDTNRITFFDATALLDTKLLQIFDASHNPDLEFPKVCLQTESDLVQLSFIGSKIINLPDITGTKSLQFLDARSCDLSTLARPLFGSLHVDKFLLNLVGNQIVDIAADILLPLPEGAIMNFDPYVIIWAADDIQKEEVLQKNWQINLDLTQSLKVCKVDGTPLDATMC